VKTPQTTAPINGNIMAYKYLGQFSVTFHPHDPKEKRAASSRRKRNAKFSGFDPIRIFYTNWEIVEEFLATMIRGVIQ
jgi:hypothetical protein